jgi:large repetitive protein
MKTRFACALSLALSLAASTAVAQPMITNVAPVPLPTIGGATLTISGTNFGSTAGSVLIGTSSCLTLSWNNTAITCTSPVGSGRDRPTIVVASGMSSTPFLVSYAAPSIASIDPPNAPTAGGQLLTIRGSNFSTTGVVQIGSSVCALGPTGLWSHSEIRCTLPAGHGRAAPVAITVDGQTGNGTYAYAPPIVATVSPTTGPAAGGTLLTLMGTNFGIAPSVTIGGSPCVVQTSSHGSITCRTPMGSGSQPIVVTALDQSATAPSPFVYMGSDAGADAASDAASDATVDAASDSASDASASDVTVSDVVASDVVASDVAASDVAASDVTVSDVTVSDVAASDVAASDAAASDAATSADASGDAGGGPVAGGGCGCVVPGSDAGHTQSSGRILVAMIALGAALARRARRG